MSDNVQEAKLTLREERAEVTRRRIADAAEALFANDGYGATTLRAIAARAGVAVQTVYAVYGSKAGILDTLRERVVHDPQAEALFGAVLAEPNAARRLALFARSIRTRWEQGATILMIHRDAAMTDPAVRTGVERVLARRRAGIGQLAEALAPNLVAGLDASRASGILDALTLPEVWAELREIHGWTADEYEAWLWHGLVQQLLGAGTDEDGTQSRSIDKADSV
jgi:AcrR family transcriptional regulator